jgi:hypothetical protein
MSKDPDSYALRVVLESRQVLYAVVETRVIAALPIWGSAFSFYKSN